jgi:hypothetical protein
MIFAKMKSITRGLFITLMNIHDASIIFTVYFLIVFYFAID